MAQIEVPQSSGVRLVGWSDPEGSRPHLGALLLGYFEPDGRLLYAGRVGTGMSEKTLATLHKRPQPLAIKGMAAGGQARARDPAGEAGGVTAADRRVEDMG